MSLTDEVANPPEISEIEPAADGPVGSARRDTRSGILMALPAIIGLIVFVVIPFLLAIYLSTQNVKLNSPRPPKFVGLEQYQRILFDEQFAPTFWRGLLNNAIFALVVVPVQTALALGIAMLLNRPLRGMGAFRTLFFMPVVFPMALVAVIWKLIYARSDEGLLNAALHTITFGNFTAQDWLGDTKWALLSIIVLSIWQGVGFQMVIILAALQGIPSSLYEAASIDKANSWKQFRYITLPQLRNTLIFVVMVTSILAFRLFDQVYILTAGGPQNSTTTVMYQAVTTAFDQNNVGRASAITVVFFVIVLTLTLIQRRVLREEVD